MSGKVLLALKDISIIILFHTNPISREAEEKGFEPLIPFRVYILSRHASSTTPALLRSGCKNNGSSPISDTISKFYYYVIVAHLFQY